MHAFFLEGGKKRDVHTQGQYARSYGTGATHLILVTKKGEKQNLPKTLKMAIFKRTFL